MAVTSINSTQAWRLALTGEAAVDTFTGEIQLTTANLSPGAGSPGAFASLAVTDNATVGGTIEVNGDATVGNFESVGTTTVYELVAVGAPVNLSGATSFAIPEASPLNTYLLQVYINTFKSSNAVVGYVTVPLGGDGTIVSASAVAAAAPTTGPATLTGAIGATPITTGVISIATSDAAGTAKTVTPSAANVVAAGDVVKFTVGGTNDAEGAVMITLTVRRAAP
jgi:hypothetical protein